jgi:hypothetical protein
MSAFDRPSSVYCKALEAVKNKEHVQVQKFQFQKQNTRNGCQLYKMTDLTNQSSVVLSSASKTYDAHREPTFNVWIWADTLEPVQEIGGEGDAPLEKSTLSKSTKTINRNLTLQQQKHIMIQVLFGDQIHPTTKIKIEPFQRHRFGFQGHFYTSVVTHLNASSADSGPFKVAPATVDKTKDFVETGVIARMQNLKQKYGENFMDRKDWNTFNDRPDSDDGSFESAMRDEINSMFDALVYGSYEPEAGGNGGAASSKSNPVYTPADDDVLAAAANGGAKRPKREHVLEPVKPKAVNSVAQYEERTSAITKMVDSLHSIMADQSASAAPSVGRANSSPAFNPELKPLLASLLALPNPPGTTTTCELLATGLGRYGIIKLAELQEMDRGDAEKILTGLNWSPMQIAKVLPKVVVHQSPEPASATNVCTICLEELVFNQARNVFENVIFTACQHGFHINCLATHRRTAASALHGENNPKCPNCNCELL